MTKHVSSEQTYYHEQYVYDGNTAIERIRTFAGRRVVRDWLLFDTVEEAMSYFNNDIE